MNPSQSTPITVNAPLIKALRIHFELSQIDLASMSKLSFPTIYAIETGRQPNPRLDTISAIAKVFNINPIQLLKTENEFPHNSSLASTIAARI